MMIWDISEMELDEQGYNDMGHYYGTGDPLWVCQTEDGSVSTQRRAATREEMEAEILRQYPGATFAF